MITACNAESLSMSLRHHVTLAITRFAQHSHALETSSTKGDHRAVFELTYLAPHSHEYVWWEFCQSALCFCAILSNQLLLCSREIRGYFSEDMAQIRILFIKVLSTNVLQSKPFYIRCIFIWGLCCQNQVSQAGISIHIPQFTVGCNYLSLSEIPASGRIWHLFSRNIACPISADPVGNFVKSRVQVRNCRRNYHPACFVRYLA